ncbi:exported hypothetical protein [Candidatus Sulfotelmatobacter kueseliae]|uniref:Uncharacterized protein n=1 Tax=Candidatus Sulfotelmatobacter kueseliae TaxID=2042962 RepID=A0A2U3LC18_9BACT|nr:exported hypothetical protein [Candidatus Sulfotelmatobacter kueseliae]
MKRWPKRTWQHIATVVVVSMQLIALVIIMSIILWPGQFAHWLWSLRPQEVWPALFLSQYCLCCFGCSRITFRMMTFGRNGNGKSSRNRRVVLPSS